MADSNKNSTDDSTANQQAAEIADARASQSSQAGSSRSSNRQNIEVEPPPRDMNVADISVDAGNQQVPPPEVLPVVNQVISSVSALRINVTAANSTNQPQTQGTYTSVGPKIRRVRSDYCASSSGVYNNPNLNAPQSRLSIVIPVGGGNSSLGDQAARNAVETNRRKEANRVQQSGATLRERNSKMLFNELMSDVTFVVGEERERIPAHSYLLAIGSTVFHAMFYTDFPRFEEVELTDVEPSAFRILLTYLYTDDIELNADTVMGTLYAAKKYLVTHLVNECIEYLTVSLNASNVCTLLSQSTLFEETELMQRCWEIIDAQSALALMSSGFLDVDSATLKEIVSRDTLQVRETVLFESVIEWAKHQCRKQERDSSSVENIRDILGSIFYQIRIPSMKIEDFANLVAKSGYLTYEETTSVFLYLAAADKPELPFVCRPRRGMKLHRCHRFQSSAYRGKRLHRGFSSNQWRYRGRCDSVQFACDRRIFVAGFGLYGSSNGVSDYKVSIELKLGDQVLGKTKQEFVCDGSSDVFPVYFRQPIQIEPTLFYTANACLDGVELSYFGQEGMPETQANNVTFLFQCSSESTNGTGVQGGQLPEILFYGGNATDA